MLFPKDFMKKRLEKVHLYSMFWVYRPQQIRNAFFSSIKLFVVIQKCRQKLTTFGVNTLICFVKDNGVHKRRLMWKMTWLFSLYRMGDLLCLLKYRVPQLRAFEWRIIDKFKNYKINKIP